MRTKKNIGFHGEGKTYKSRQKRILCESTFTRFLLICSIHWTQAGAFLAWPDKDLDFFRLKRPPQPTVKETWLKGVDGTKLSVHWTYSGNLKWEAKLGWSFSGFSVFCSTGWVYWRSEHLWSESVDKRVETNWRNCEAPFNCHRKMESSQWD